MNELRLHETVAARIPISNGQSLNKSWATPTSTMKTIGTLSFLTLLFLCNGCMTYSSVQRARGHGGQWVEIKPSDQIVQNDGTNCVIRRISQEGEPSQMRLHLITPNAGYVFKPGYYALLPLTVPADIATLPFQLIFFLVAPVG